MRRYERYKDSGIEWVGEIPAHWNTYKLKWISKLLYGDSLKEEDRATGEIPVFGSNGIIGFHSHAITQSPCLIIGRKGSFGKINYSETSCFPIDTTFFIDHRATSHNIRWLYYLLSMLKLDSVSKDSAVPGLAREEAYEKILPVPLSDEQTAIANYLDHKTSEIDQLITKKQQLIELLQEEKTALINQAVTKGLNPDAPMKDSGIEWLGEVPGHWVLSKIKFACKVKGRIGFRGYTTGDLVEKGKGALALGATQINDDGEIDLSKPVFISWEKYYESPEIMISVGDIVIVQRGSTCGKVGLVNYNLTPATINPSLVLLKEININSEYLFNFLRSISIRNFVNNLISSTAIPMLSQEQIGDMKILIPDDEEQQQIVDYIKQEEQKTRAAITEIIKEIELLQEYRTALISETVTGKIDVRQWAANRGGGTVAG